MPCGACAHTKTTGSPGEHLAYAQGKKEPPRLGATDYLDGDGRRRGHLRGLRSWPGTNTLSGSMAG